MSVVQEDSRVPPQHRLCFSVRSRVTFSTCTTTTRRVPEWRGRWAEEKHLTFCESVYNPANKQMPPVPLIVRTSRYPAFLSSPPGNSRVKRQSQPNLLRLSPIGSEAYPRNARCQTQFRHLAYFQQLRTKERAFFSKRPDEGVSDSMLDVLPLGVPELWPRPGGKSSLRSKLECALKSSGCLEKVRLLGPLAVSTERRNIPAGIAAGVRSGKARKNIHAP